MSNLDFNVQAFLDEDSETFTYVVFDQQGGQGVVIDPVLDFDIKSGRTSTTGADRVLHFVQQNELSIAYILETHAHADHLSAAPYLRDKLQSKIGIGEHIRDVQKIFKDVFNLEKEFLPNGAQFDRLFKDGDTFSVGGLHFQVIHTPGHTPADIAYYLNGQALFVGDTLFLPDVGTARCDFPGGSSATLYQSIQKLLALPADTQMYICHDYPPEGRAHQFVTTVKAQREESIHVRTGVTSAEFERMRDERDATLAMPRLILPAIQVNIRAGEMPPAEANGAVYLKIPINQL
ncbi:MBL fold metallo-hydrolase [Aliidiomarina haloalkalitolerans]|uniref:MBL fold metallo-hydrolase n=1 Tax=Aliidiomarina haloalkalitolerans TaxID=859059 RepID=A0A432VYY0_9GAMM|nr:MBL fold metallo-hydrolase [Aliidiomarina haloalkalitolerans]RUO21865.1 MBL fold metallo-hydrolase [Aliidiomarina haloalkalitolerans]